jgi:glycosyltransferase involved in cell wall biosynthesis
VQTAAFILRRRPSGVIVQNPPVVAALVAYGATRIVGAHLVIDSHPAALTRTGPRRWLPDRVNRWLARRVDAVMVTVTDLAERIGVHGGRGIVLHEAPPHMEPSEPRAAEERLRVLVVSRFAPDEPVHDVVKAAAELPELDFVITGERRLRPARLAEHAPPNVEFPGFLSIGDYQRALGEAHIVMALTTRKFSVSRAAYDAVWALRPLIVSGGPQMPELFPHAVVVENTAQSIAAGLRDAAARYPELARDARADLELARERWEQQLADLRSALA